MKLISSSTGNRCEAARWHQVSHYNSFILIPAHGAVKIAHLRVQQQPERKMSSLYIREPDSPTDESPRLLLPPTTTLLGHDEYYNILLHTWRLISLHGMLHCGSHSLRSPAETFIETDWSSGWLMFFTGIHIFDSSTSGLTAICWVLKTSRNNTTKSSTGNETYLFFA